MKTIFTMLAACMVCGSAYAQETAFVKSDVANERSGPGSEYPVQNKVYVGQKLTIYDRQNGFARVTAPQYDPRWISESLLSKTKPDVAKGFTLPGELRRADLANLPDKPETNLDGQDVLALRRFGAHVLDTKQCSGIEYGDESVNQSGQIYVMCSDLKKKYADKAEWIR
ncbi:MAG TPA: SH3 domain-containing protein [Hyphomonadaceae bacterium]|jgi:uncharacterized protein YgiM (DUF1202 family)|nr:SH3 domain-containing protein [Hyphomonadaceae bacterium]